LLENQIEAEKELEELNSENEEQQSMLRAYESRNQLMTRELYRLKNQQSMSQWGDVVHNPEAAQLPIPNPPFPKGDVPYKLMQ